MPDVEETIEFIKAAHAGQTDKSGRAYWHHPVSVMHRLGDRASEEEKLAALLHDVIEDTTTTADDLRTRGYAGDVIEAVKVLSRPRGVAYLDWIRSIAAGGNGIAMRVKIADIEDNLDLARVAALPSPAPSLVQRYKSALQILRARLGKL